MNNLLSVYCDYFINASQPVVYINIDVYTLPKLRAQKKLWENWFNLENDSQKQNS